MILCELCVSRTSLYICAQLNSSGGGNTSTVHKRSTCSTYWRMVPLQRGLKIQRRRYSQSGFHTLTTEARVRFIVWETLFLWHLLFIWERHCVNFCIFKILGFFCRRSLWQKIIECVIFKHLYWPLGIEAVVYRGGHFYWERKLHGVHGENHRSAASHWQTLSHNVVSSTPRRERD
jgi:hypothetical protein